MKKLWTHQKGNNSIERFTAGNDPELDLVLVPYDIMGSIAHTKGLRKIGILTKQEEAKLVKVLGEIHAQWKRGLISISASDEDCHTAIENMLTKKLGDVGKKIHTGRSRNDQVLTALRLYMKEKLIEAEGSVDELIRAFKKKAREYKNVPMPGYTHMQRAMPSSASLWLGAFAVSLNDDLKIMKTTLDIIDQSPLGSVVGYGEKGLGLDRGYTAKTLGFKKVQENALYAANSRGKFELLVLQALAPAISDIGKFATDTLLFSTKEFGFVSLSDELTTGSSAMPRKRNYDVLELLRAHASQYASSAHTLAHLIDKLPSGYNRDYQLTKKLFIEGIENGLAMIEIAELVVTNLVLDADAMKSACTPELYATDEAYQLVKTGVPFRDAYQQIAKKYRIL